jgi:membrane protease YdiL (CAAX protease family)
VEAIQYSVPLWLGIILYGIVSPIAEEIVFRGVLYNRTKRFYSIPRSVIFSALLFGIFHANLPQLIYGTLMGVLIALCYERNKCFAAPVFFHMAANIVVFTLSFI